jgi:hypothetical protein
VALECERLQPVPNQKLDPRADAAGFGVNVRIEDRDTPDHPLVP